MEATSISNQLCRSIEEEVEHIKQQQARGKWKRVIESAEDKDDLIKHYRRIEGLFRQLQVSVQPCVIIAKSDTRSG